MLRAEDRANELCKIMENIVGIKDVRARVRFHPYPMLRAMIWTQMRKEGYSVMSCGKTFGKDHATVTYNVAKWTSISDDRLPGWNDYIAIWDAFQRDVSELPSPFDRDYGDRITVAALQEQISGIPDDATVVVESCKKRSINYDKELNTLFIRG